MGLFSSKLNPTLDEKPFKTCKCGTIATYRCQKEFPYIFYYDQDFGEKMRRPTAGGYYSTLGNYIQVLSSLSPYWSETLLQSREG